MTTTHARHDRAAAATTRVPAGKGREVEIVGLCLALGVVAATALLRPSDQESVATVTAYTGLVLSVVTWLAAGGREATPGGVLAISTGMFAYFPTLYYLNSGVYHPYLRYSVLLVFLVQIATTALLLTQPREPRPLTRPDPVTLQLCVVYGIILLSVGAAIVQQFELPSTSLPAAASFVGATLIMYGSLQGGTQLRMRSLVISGVAIALYMAFLFTTGGRLVIAALVFTGVVLAAGRLKTNAFKALVVVGLIPALLAAARQRASVISTTRGVQESGLESVIWPMDRLSLLLSMSHGGQLPPSGGDTLWSTAVFWFPRSLWPEKPNGFGADLTAAIRPDLVGTGHSEAATLLGEWVWDFGIWSLFALPLVAALCLVLLRKLRDATPGFASRDLRVSMHLTSALATAGMLDVFWIGTFGFASRTGQRLIIIALFAIVLALTPRARASRDQDTSRTASRNRRKGRGARVHAGARQPSTPPAAHGTL